MRKSPTLSQFRKKWAYPLHVAMREGHMEFFEILLSEVSNTPAINILQAASGYSLLYRAIVSGQPEMLVSLLKQGADPNIPQGPRADKLPLLLALRYGKRNLMKLLLLFGADMACEAAGNTPSRVLATKPEALKEFVTEVLECLALIKDSEAQAKSACYHGDFVGAALHYKAAAEGMQDLGSYGFERSLGDQIKPVGMEEFDPELETYGERTAFVYTEKACQLYQHVLKSLQMAAHHGEADAALYEEIVRVLEEVSPTPRDAEYLTLSDYRASLLLWSTTHTEPTPEAHEAEQVPLLDWEDPQAQLQALMNEREAADLSAEQKAALDHRIQLLLQHLSNTDSPSVQC